MRSVSLLPQELGCAQEQACTHLPAQHICPLVAKDWKVAIRLNPVAVCIPNDCFRCRANDKLLLKSGCRIYYHTLSIGIGLQAIVCHHSALLCKTLHMVGLTAEERLRDKQWEIGIHVACGLKHIIELTLHLLPDCISVGLNHHAASHCRLLCKVGFHNKFIIPLRVIVGSLG